MSLSAVLPPKFLGTLAYALTVSAIITGAFDFYLERMFSDIASQIGGVLYVFLGILVIVVLKIHYMKEVHELSRKLEPTIKWLALLELVTILEIVGLSTRCIFSFLFH